MRSNLGPAFSSHPAFASLRQVDADTLTAEHPLPEGCRRLLGRLKNLSVVKVSPSPGLDADDDANVDEESVCMADDWRAAFAAAGAPSGPAGGRLPANQLPLLPTWVSLPHLGPAGRGSTGSQSIADWLFVRRLLCGVLPSLTRGRGGFGAARSLPTPGDSWSWECPSVQGEGLQGVWMRRGLGAGLACTTSSLYNQPGWGSQLYRGRCGGAHAVVMGASAVMEKALESASGYTYHDVTLLGTAATCWWALQLPAGGQGGASKIWAHVLMEQFIAMWVSCGG